MGYTSDTERRKMQIKEMQIKAAIKHHYLIPLPNRAHNKINGNIK